MQRTLTLSCTRAGGRAGVRALGRGHQRSVTVLPRGPAAPPPRPQGPRIGERGGAGGDHRGPKGLGAVGVPSVLRTTRQEAVNVRAAGPRHRHGHRQAAPKPSDRDRDMPWRQYTTAVPCSGRATRARPCAVLRGLGLCWRIDGVGGVEEQRAASLQHVCSDCRRLPSWVPPPATAPRTDWVDWALPAHVIRPHPARG